MVYILITGYLFGATYSPMSAKKIKAPDVPSPYSGIKTSQV